MNHALMADILEESKNWLWDGVKISNSEASICMAVQKAAMHLYSIGPTTRRYGNYSTAAKDIREWIWKATDGSHSAGTYLLSKGFSPNMQQLQAYRLAWINQMIGVLRS